MIMVQYAPAIMGLFADLAEAELKEVVVRTVLEAVFVVLSRPA